LRQFQGLHPQGSKYLSDAYRARSKFFRPKTRAAVRKNEAIAAEALFQTTDVVSITPMDDDNQAQLASAEINKELLQYRLTKTIPWFLIAMGAYQDAQVQGICVLVPTTGKYNKQKNIDQPCIELRPIENIRFDPAADWYDPVGSSPYFIDMIPMYVEGREGADENADQRASSSEVEHGRQAQLLKACTMLLDVVRMQREPGRVDPRSPSQQITAYTIVWVHRNIVEVDGEDWIYHTLGTVAMLDKPRPLRKVYFHGKRPYTIGFSVIETHKSYPPGPVRLTGRFRPS
jgi:hypothetical protein